MSTPEPPPYPGDATPEPSGGLPSYGSVPPNDYSASAAIAWGWRKFTENTGPAILAAFTLVVAYAALVIGGEFLYGPLPSSPSEFVAQSPFEIVGSLVVSAAGVLLSGIMAKATLEVADGRSFDLFGAISKVNGSQLVLASLIISVVLELGNLVPVDLGVAWLTLVTFLTYFVPYAIVDDSKPVVDGISQGIMLVWNNLGSSLMLAFLCLLVIIAGFLVLFVGVVVAMPVTALAAAYAYRSFNGQPVAQPD